VGIIAITQPANQDPAVKLCTHHYHKLIGKMRELHGGEGRDDEEGIEQLTNQEILALIDGDEFRRTIAKLAGDARVSGVIKRLAKRANKSRRRSG
jgi:hypothetical protein